MANLALTHMLKELVALFFSLKDKGYTQQGQGGQDVAVGGTKRQTLALVLDFTNTTYTNASRLWLISNLSVVLRSSI